MDQAVRLSGQHWCRGHRRRLAVPVALDRQIKKPAGDAKISQSAMIKRGLSVYCFSILHRDVKTPK
jgi:hypothetical protein